MDVSAARALPLSMLMVAASAFPAVSLAGKALTFDVLVLSIN